jgi:RluA family pseudouridine synthase
MDDSNQSITGLILWADETLLAVNKPAGLRAIPDGYDAALPALNRLLESQYGHVWIVHRLDKNTSGVILYARNPEAHRSLSMQFAQRETGKSYHAIVVGSPPWDAFTIDYPLIVNGDRSHRTIALLPEEVHKHDRAEQKSALAKPAQTNLRLLRRSGGYSLVEAQPLTGYTHQIRAHLAALGLPILADPLYRSLHGTVTQKNTPTLSTPDFAIQRLALHALSIKFFHPASGHVITLHAPYPEDYLYALQVLGLDE